ncbi:hypothetical protein B0H63DRAFT_487282 [Podospora didyma]|uniref:Yeast cell wall synthesis Kre9/Knh1-like N-terminal domain-containing protein n=1 Tax=Podospora didyma TaxID=330526 RepID=A0AAE0K5T3_9PEZI|nr:hypothetical protein B0H63DRAFT_487282 [Podospora didyma]
MRLFRWRQILATFLLLLLPSCLARPAIINTDFNITENQPFTIRWIGASAPVKIELLKGDINTLSTQGVIADGVPGTSFEWTPRNLTSGTYVFKIDDGVSDTNYSPLFAVTTTQMPQNETTQVSQNEENRSDGGLSTGAKAGIGIGAALGGIGIIAAIAFVFYRRGKEAAGRAHKLATGGVDETSEGAAAWSKAELGEGDMKDGILAEMGGCLMAEMGTSANVAELDPTSSFKAKDVTLGSGADRDRTDVLPVELSEVPPVELSAVKLPRGDS